MLEKNIIINDLNIHFYQSDVLNCNSPVIFLHGWGSQASHMKSIFEKNENFIAMDLPGFGKSEKPSYAWTTGDYAELLRGLLLKLEISQPILVGHSFGGSIIIKYCSKYHDVKKNILIGSAGIRRKSFRLSIYKIGAMLFNLIFFFPIMKRTRYNLRKKFYKLIGSEDYLNTGEMKETFQKVINDDLSDEMKKMDVETTLIWGAKDPETPILDANEMHKLIASSKLLVISEAGHYVFLDKKDEFNKIFFGQLS